MPVSCGRLRRRAAPRRSMVPTNSGARETDTPLGTRGRLLHRRVGEHEQPTRPSRRHSNARAPRGPGGGPARRAGEPLPEGRRAPRPMGPKGGGCCGPIRSVVGGRNVWPSAFAPKNLRRRPASTDARRCAASTNSDGAHPEDSAGARPQVHITGLGGTLPEKNTRLTGCCPTEKK